MATETTMMDTTDALEVIETLVDADFDGAPMDRETAEMHLDEHAAVNDRALAAIETLGRDHAIADYVGTWEAIRSVLVAD